MEGDVKALINLKDGTIQLEGPRTFVEKYLDQYKQLIISLPTTPKISKITEPVEPEAEKTSKRKTRTKGGQTCSPKVLELLSEGYFKEPRTRKEVQSALLEKGYRARGQEASVTLMNYLNSGKLKRTGAGSTAKYYSNE